MVRNKNDRLPFDASAFVRGLSEGPAQAQQAGRRLIKDYRPLLRARFFSEGVKAQDVDDLVADVLTAIIAKVHQLRDLDRFDAWVYAIGSNLLNRHWTQKYRDREMFQDPPSGHAEAGEAIESASEWLREVVDPSQADPGTERCLSLQLQQFREQHPHRYACIELLVMGHDAREVASQTGRTYGATRQFISQCCALLTQFLAPCLEAAQLLGRRRGRAEAE